MGLWMDAMRGGDSPHQITLLYTVLNLRCWLGGRKSIQPVKCWVVICPERTANDLHIVQLMPLPPHHLLLLKIQNGLLLWCLLTQIVREKPDIV